MTAAAVSEVLDAPFPGQTSSSANCGNCGSYELEPLER